eukprot:UN10002
MLLLPKNIRICYYDDFQIELHMPNLND